MNQETVMHQCIKCGTSTGHNPTRSPGARMIKHVGEMLVCVASLGFVCPHAFGTPEMGAECAKCKTRISVPYQ
jgi:hypothetical protein